MNESVPESVRAVILTPAHTVLLMKIQSGSGAGVIWITPGGRRRQGEDTLHALRRELLEETGLRGFHAEAEIWVRHGTFTRNGRTERERERFYLIRMPEFTPTARAMELEEANRFAGFRWWALAEIATSLERFVPRRMAVLLETLARDGPPPAPTETGE